MQKLNDLSRCLTPLEPDGTLIAVNGQPGAPGGRIEVGESAVQAVIREVVKSPA